jgi:hypothetical protein
MFFQIDACLENRDALGFQKFSLQGSNGFADKEFAAIANNTVPGDAPARRSGSHSPSYGSATTTQAQGFSQRPIGSNPAARNLLYDVVDGIPAHGDTHGNGEIAREASDRDLCKWEVFDEVEAQKASAVRTRKSNGTEQKK